MDVKTIMEVLGTQKYNGLICSKPYRYKATRAEIRKALKRFFGTDDTAVIKREHGNILVKLINTKRGVRVLGYDTIKENEK